MEHLFICIKKQIDMLQLQKKCMFFDGADHMTYDVCVWSQRQ